MPRRSAHPVKAIKVTIAARNAEVGKVKVILKDQVLDLSNIIARC
jgi:hypothetical protein